MARIPLYKAAETEMIRRIHDGDWPVGLRLPNEFGLAREFGVSQGTMRRALITLEGMGLLHRKPGRGTVVAEPGTADTATGGAEPDFGRLTDPAGEAPALEVFRARAGLRGADAGETALFETSRLATLDRTLRRDGDRFALDEIMAAETRIPAFDEDAPAGLAALLTAHGHAPARIEDRIGAAITTMSEAVALSCDRHTAVLVLARTARDETGAIIARQRLRMIAEDMLYQAAGTA